MDEKTLPITNSPGSRWLFGSVRETFCLRSCPHPSPFTLHTYAHTNTHTHTYNAGKSSEFPDGRERSSAIARALALLRGYPSSRILAGKLCPHKLAKTLLRGCWTRSLCSASFAAVSVAIFLETAGARDTAGRAYGADTRGPEGAG